jgi:hypothetical protein
VRRGRQGPHNNDDKEIKQGQQPVPPKHNHAHFSVSTLGLAGPGSLSLQSCIDTNLPIYLILNDSSTNIWMNQTYMYACHGDFNNNAKNGQESGLSGGKKQQRP